jgi:hypothetical protein
MATYCQWKFFVLYLGSQRPPVSSGPNYFKVCTAFTQNRYLHAAVPWRPVLSKLEAFAKQEAL